MSELYKRVDSSIQTLNDRADNSYESVQALRDDVSSNISHLIKRLLDLEKGMSSLACEVTKKDFNKMGDKVKNQSHELRHRIRDLEQKHNDIVDTIVELGSKFEENTFRIMHVINTIAEKNGLRVELVDATEEHVEVVEVEKNQKDERKK